MNAQRKPQAIRRSRRELKMIHERRRQDREQSIAVAITIVFAAFALIAISAAIQ
jgi:hypothetical protein